MRRTKLRVWHWHEPVYNVLIWLVHGSAMDFERWMQREYDKAYRNPPHASRAGTLWLGAALVFWIAPGVRCNADWCGVLAHEAVHGAHYVFGARGVSTEHGAEALPYYVAYLVWSIASRLWAKKK